MTNQIPQNVIEYIQREIRRSTNTSRELTRQIAENLANTTVNTPSFVENSKDLYRLSQTIAWLEELRYAARISNEYPEPTERETITAFIVNVSAVRVPDTQADRYTHKSIIELLTQNR